MGWSRASVGRAAARARPDKTFSNGDRVVQGLRPDRATLAGANAASFARLAGTGGGAGA